MPPRRPNPPKEPRPTVANIDPRDDEAFRRTLRTMTKSKRDNLADDALHVRESAERVAGTKQSVRRTEERIARSNAALRRARAALARRPH